MEKAGDEQSLPLGNNPDPATIASFVQMLPALYYGVNRLLDVCSPAFPRKVIVVLWTLASSTTKDDVGTFIATADINRTFRDWFVVSDSNVSSEVSKVKDALFDLKFIKIEGGKDHIHLTQRGEDALRDTLAKASSIVQETLAALTPEEHAMLKDFARRMLKTIRKPVRVEEAPGNNEQQGVA